MIDPNGIAGGASGTPLGLVNPATGRYATLTWKAKECFDSILGNLKFVQQHTNAPIFKQSGILRPALDRKIATRMKSNFENMDWPQKWIEWMDEVDIKEFHPGISSNGGGVWLPKGITVDISTYLHSFFNELTTRGLHSEFNQNKHLEWNGFEWKISFKASEVITSKNIIFTTGAYTNKVALWENLPLYPVKGQLAVMKSSIPICFDHSISALGYISPLKENHFVIGSTYEHDFKYEHTDKEGLIYLIARFKKVLPGLAKKSKAVKQWSGIRASTPNRMPILGVHPTQKNCFMFAGLGSKGLLYSSYLSLLFSEFLINRTPLPKEIGIERFKKE